jgi:hypothetical protein
VYSLDAPSFFVIGGPANFNKGDTALMKYTLDTNLLEKEVAAGGAVKWRHIGGAKCTVEHKWEKKGRFLRVGKYDIEVGRKA